MKKTKIQMAPSSATDFFIPLLNQLNELFNRRSYFSSDESNLLMTVSDLLPGILGEKEKLFIIQEIKNAFGVTITEKQLSDKFKDFLPWFSKQNHKYDTTYKLNNFLGILKISDQNRDSWHLGYFFGIKQHYEYLKGFTMGKSITPDKQSSWNLILEDIETMHKQLFDINEINHFIIETIEGDKVLCHNMNEVCSWVVARGSNYSQSGKKQDW